MQEQKRNFSISEELRKLGAQDDIIQLYQLIKSNYHLCMDTHPLLSLEEVQQFPQGTFRFFQKVDGCIRANLYFEEVDTSRPFLMVERECTPSECPLQPGSNVLHVCFGE